MPRRRIQDPPSDLPLANHCSLFWLFAQQKTLKARRAIRVG
jgi:hypothetical protein